MNDAIERWLPVPEYEGLYEVSDQGRVRSLDRIVTVTPSGGTAYQYRHRGRILKPLSGLPHPRVNLRGVQYCVHVLVLLAFVGPRPEGQQACHYDDDPTNNHLSNLRWDTPRANSIDQVRNNRHPQARKTHCKRGHEFTDENTTNVRTASGSYRRCRECARMLWHTRYKP